LESAEEHSCHSCDRLTVYMSIAVRNNMYFVLYHYCCEGRYSVNIHLKCLEKSGNLIMTGEWPPCV